MRWAWLAAITSSSFLLAAGNDPRTTIGSVNLAELFADHGGSFIPVDSGRHGQAALAAVTAPCDCCLGYDTRVQTRS